MGRQIHVSRQFQKKSIVAAVLLLSATLAKAQAVSVTDGSAIPVVGSLATTSSGLFGVGLYVTNGSTATGSANITTGGTNAQGVYVASGGNVQLGDSSLATTGRQSPAVFAFLGNASAALSNVTIQTSGDWSHGAEANNDSTVTLQNGSIDTSGQYAYGLYNIGTGANLSATGTVVTTTGTYSSAAYNQAGGLMTLDDVSLTTTGANAHGVQIGSRGVIGDGSSSDIVNMANSTVTTTGAGSNGLLASDNATLNGTNVTVSTSGASSYGAAAEFGAQMQLQGGSVTTTGDGAAGLLVAGLPATVGDPGTAVPSIIANGLAVSTAGQSAPAAMVAAGSHLSMTDSSLTSTGAGSDVVLGGVLDTTAPATASFTGSTLVSTQADGLHANGAALDVNLSSSMVTAGANVMNADTDVQTGLGGALNVLADASTLTGAASVDQASILNATLRNNSTWNVTGLSDVSTLTLDNGTVRYLSAAQLNAGGLTLGAGGGTFDTNGFDAGVNADIDGSGALLKAGDGMLTLSGTNTYSGATTVGAGTLQAGGVGAFSPGSSFTVGSAGVLDLNGFNQTVASLGNSGTVRFGTTPGTVLTVAGDYAGDGGVLAMNTALGDSSSTTDLLHVQGATSGSTGVQVVNAGGLGAQTAGDGIMMVQVDGASNGAFTQTRRIEAGAYEYTLYKGGVGTDAANGNWYLRSTLENDQSPADVPTIDDTRSATEDPAPLAYRPGTVGYVMTPQLNAGYGFSMLGTLHQRVGDVPGAVRPSQTNTDGVWGRIDGQTLRADAMNRFSADSRSLFAQFGKDWTVASSDKGGSTHAGVTLSVGSASADFSDSLRSLAGLDTSTGSVQTQMQSIGGYWTRYLADGTYSDSVAQVAHYHNRYDDSAGNTPGQNGFSIAASQEIGKPFQLSQLPIAFEPQAQLAYQYMNLRGFSDNVSAVSGTTINSLRGRIGFRLFRADMENESQTSTATPYVTANVLHDFLAPGQTVVGGTPFDAGFSRTWLDVGAGVTVAYGKRGELYASAGYLRNLGGQRREGATGNAGFRYSW
ncbi:MAG TPA: autotransporter outer membrane beta-barrel domain-containing protein [Paraburkholderia sp.]|nr:autotransporter outer membrane beta-barrel domain-containing protein [Paraburkholderia sp.]